MVNNCGLYIVSDDFFAKYDPEHKLMLNKNEHRPYYCGLTLSSGIVWLVPLSSRVDKYQKSISLIELKRGKGSCVFYYIAKVKSEERAFLIGDAFPCTEKYIKKPFTIAGQPYVVQNKNDVVAIRKRLSRFLSLVRSGKLHPNADIIAIEKSLLRER